MGTSCRWKCAEGLAASRKPWVCEFLSKNKSGLRLRSGGPLPKFPNRMPAQAYPTGEVSLRRQDWEHDGRESHWSHAGGKWGAGRSRESARPRVLIPGKNTAGMQIGDIDCGAVDNSRRCRAYGV